MRGTQGAGRTQAAADGAQNADGRTQNAEGRVQGVVGRMHGAEGRMHGAEGRTHGAEGRTQGAEGRTQGAEGRTQGAEGRTQGAEGRTQDAEGRTQDAEGRTQGEGRTRGWARRAFISLAIAGSLGFVAPSVGAAQAGLGRVVVLPSYGVPDAAVASVVTALEGATGVAGAVAVPRDDECLDGGHTSEPCQRILEDQRASTLLVVSYFPAGEERTEPVLSLGVYGAAQFGVRRPVPADVSVQAACVGLVTEAVGRWPAELRVEVRVEGTPEGAAVRVHGGPTGSLPALFALSAGTHRITVTAPGFEPMERELIVDHDTPLVERVALREAQGETSAPTPSGRGSAWPSYALGAALLAGGAAMLAPGFYALANDGECVDPCRRAGDEPRPLLKADFSGADIALIVAGSALAVGGVVVLALRPLRVSPAVTPTSASIHVQAEF